MKLTPAPQLNLFTNLSDMMNPREARNYDDPKAWQNVFYDEVTCKVKGLTFKPLSKNNVVFDLVVLISPMADERSSLIHRGDAGISPTFSDAAGHRRKGPARLASSERRGPSPPAKTLFHQLLTLPCVFGE